jgi:hypothetical protein
MLKLDKLDLALSNPFEEPCAKPISKILGVEPKNEPRH